MKMWLCRIALALVFVLGGLAWLGVFGAIAIFASIVTIFLLVDRARFASRLDQIVSSFESGGRGSRLVAHKKLGVWLGLERIRYRLETLSWESSVVAAQTAGCDVQIDNQHLNGDRDFLIAALIKLGAQFRCTSAALVVASGAAANQRQVISSGALHGRVERQLFRVFAPFFDSGIDQAFGRQELGASQSPFSGLASLGFGWSISFPLQWRTGQVAQKAVLWLGYSRQSPPAELEEQRAKSFALKLERELAANERIRELSGRVSAAEGVSRKKSDFIAQMSHDIRSPLNNIRSILTLFKLDGFASDTPDMIQVALNNCDSLGEIVEDILDYSKHSSGKLVAVGEPVYLGNVASAVAEAFSYGARMKGLELVVDSNGGDLLAWCDRRHLKRILSNLVSNAVKYTSHGRVTLKIRKFDEHSVDFSISDTGPGMAKEQIAQLFTPFTRFHGSEIEGIGLGLAVTRILAEMNDAVISVESIVGRGTTFNVRFKIARSQVEPLSINYEHLVHKSTLADCALNLIGNGRIVLVVDDDVDCVDTLAKGMERLGFKALRAVKVSEAIGITNYESVDLVITDATMPEGGGRRLVSYLASTKPKIAVVVLSGRQSSEEQKEFAEMGAAGIFSKPIDFVQLETWLHELYHRNTREEMVA